MSRLTQPVPTRDLACGHQLQSERSSGWSERQLRVEVEKRELRYPRSGRWGLHLLVGVGRRRPGEADLWWQVLPHLALGQLSHLAPPTHCQVRVVQPPSQRP